MTDSRKEPHGHGGGLLLCVALVLGVLVVQYADVPLAAQLRERVQTVLTGAGGAAQALETLGGGAVSTAAEPAASSGSADDILGREKTLFPDAIDQTVYPMEFAHAQPTAGTVSSTFGSRISPTTGQPGFHYGVDIAAAEGTAIGAFADGTVREVGESSYGNYLIVDHAGGFATLYAHCSSISAQVGDAVTCGQEIARVGQTGNATGPHLHLELWRQGAALDPSAYLTQM